MLLDWYPSIITRHVYLFVGGMYLYAQHSGFDLFVLAEIPSKNRRLKPVVALRLKIDPLRKTCSERGEPAQKVPQSEAT